jgi:very-short-patch-repair endonuclease
MPSGKVHNKKSFEQLRKTLRNSSTSAEAALWTMLKKRQIEGGKFRRQHSVGPYIVDFYCPSEKLAVELDGAYHFTSEGIAYDEERSAYLRRYNINVIRFENREVFENPEAVLEKIKSQFNHPRSAGG